MTTKGPVFSVRIRRGPLSGDFVDDRWVQAVFIAGGLVTLVVMLPAARSLVRDRSLLIATGVVVGVTAISALWSVAPDRTSQQALMFLVGSAAALLCGRRLPPAALAGAWWLAAQVGLLVSELALRRNWQFSRGENNFPAGIYFNRNSLGAVAALGVLMTGVLALMAWHQLEAGMRRAVLGVLAASLVFDGWFLVRTSSVTPTLALAFTVVVSVSVRAARLIRWTATRTSLAAAAGVAALGVGVVMYAERERQGPISALSGRDVVWGVVVDYISRRPWQGWGYFAVWTRDDIAAEQFANGVLVFESHSGYLEMVLGAGVVGALALGGFLVVAVGRTSTTLWRSTTPLEIWPAIVVVYCLVINLGETYIGPNLHPWTLMLMCLAALGVSPRPDADGHIADVPNTDREGAWTQPH